MKLRQKLAVVLATAMVVTAVPVTTMAASTNTVTRGTLAVAPEGKIGNWSATTTSVTGVLVPELKIEAKDYLNHGDEFYISIENGSWAAVYSNVEAITVANGEIEITRVSGKELKLTFKATNPESEDNRTNDTFYVPVYAFATEGDVSITVIPEQTTLSSTKHIIATTQEGVGTVEVGTVPTFYTRGDMASIKVTEVRPGAFHTLHQSGKSMIRVTIDHRDFEFQKSPFRNRIEFDGKQIDTTHIVFLKRTVSRGFANESEIEVGFIDEKDPQVMYVSLPTQRSTNSRGVVEFSEIGVVSTTRTPETGKLLVDIEGAGISNVLDAQVGTVAEYGVSLTMKDDKPVEIKEGRSGNITVTLAENVEDSMVEGSFRTVELSVDQGELVEGNNFEIKDENGRTLTARQYEKITRDDDVLEYRFIGVTDRGVIDKFTFVNLQVNVPLDVEGDIVLTAEGRAIGEKIQTTAVNIVDAIDVEAEQMVVKVGLREQKGGKIVVSEKEAGNFLKGEVITIEIEPESGITFRDVPTVEVTGGDVRVGDPKYVPFRAATATQDAVPAHIAIEVTRSSREASEITISDFKVDVNRMVPEGQYFLNVGGKAITEYGNFKMEDFILVGTPNTEDIQDKEIAITSTFTIGEKTYTVNGEEFEMDAAAFISDTNRTMVPIRFLANAFGVKPQDIIFSNGSATMILGNRTIQVTNGSNVALLNGVPVQMDTPIMIVGNRAFGSASQIGALLGISAEYTAPVATFQNALARQ